MSANASVPAAANEIVYDATVSPLPGNLPSQAFQATQTSEFGDKVTLGGTSRVLQSATVTLSDWALHNDYPSMPLAGWTHPITFNVYSVGSDGLPGTPLGSVTQTVTIPWRPAASPSCPGTAWSDGNGHCYNGKAFNATFDLSSIGSVPNEIIYGIAYNTSGYGAAPLGVGGPYDSLNVALTNTTPAGDDVTDVFWNTSTAGNYTDLGSAGVGTFRRDTGWTGFVPAVQLTASANGCSFTENNSIITLQNNCTTDQTIQVPVGKTLDGNRHSITAVDPAGSHFVGAVVTNAPATTGSITVKNLTVTTAGLTDACDAGDSRLRGILLNGVGGTVTGNTVTNIRQAGSGCQEGNAIDVRNQPEATTAVPSVNVTVTDNTVSGYQKTGIMATGAVVATITGNRVTGLGPVSYIAQNGIQVSYGASATLKSDSVAGNFYAAPTWTSCGVLLYSAGGEKSSSITYAGNQKDLCNYGKGGGNVKASA
jgi:hypothetical protein